MLRLPGLALALAAFAVTGGTAWAQAPGGSIGVEDVEVPIRIGTDLRDRRKVVTRTCAGGLRRGTCDGRIYVDCNEFQDASPIEVAYAPGRTFRCDARRLVSTFADDGSVLNCFLVSPIVLYGQTCRAGEVVSVSGRSTEPVCMGQSVSGC